MCSILKSKLSNKYYKLYNYLKAKNIINLVIIVTKYQSHVCNCISDILAYNTQITNCNALTVCIKFCTARDVGMNSSITGTTKYRWSLKLKPRRLRYTCYTHRGVVTRYTFVRRPLYLHSILILREPLNRHTVRLFNNGRRLPYYTTYVRRSG